LVQISRSEPGRRATICHAADEPRRVELLVEIAKVLGEWALVLEARSGLDIGEGAIVIGQQFLIGKGPAAVGNPGTGLEVDGF
jgi:hypothetical protein